ncbi:MAG: FtsX-like permease family protein [Pseudomonadota bacterium]|nr:FtsX-like permease family protein [Pseudomonadota bacterium]
MKMPLEIRLAMRDIRGGLGAYKIFIASVILGVASISGIGSLSESILAGIAADGRKILGGDISIRVSHRPVTKIQLKWLRKHAEISRVSSMRSMAREKKGGLFTLVNLKAIDERYPLFGRIKLTPNTDLGEILSFHNGAWGAAIDRRIAEKLKLQLHDTVSIGNTQFRVRAFVYSKPDQNNSLRALTQGPTFIVSDNSLSTTGLVRPGTQIYYEYRLKLPQRINLEDFKNRLSKAFPSAGWRVRDRNAAAPSTERFINRITQFITLVGLTALFIGGLGAGNSVRAHLAKKTNIIATLKCLGAKRKQVFAVWLTEITLVAAISIFLGLAIGAILPATLATTLAEFFPVSLEVKLYPKPLVLAGIYGLLVAAIFSLWPLARASVISPGNLFRDLTNPVRTKIGWTTHLLLGFCIAAIVVLAMANAQDLKIAAWFVTGVLVAFGVFYSAGKFIVKIAPYAANTKFTSLRFAIKNIYRRGNQTTNIVLSLGLSLSTLIAVVAVQGNLENQMLRNMPNKAPSFYFVDIQPTQVPEFENVIHKLTNIKKIDRVPILRGRITHINKISSSNIKTSPSVAWVLRSDRGLTWSATKPETAKIVKGNWWSDDYHGPPLVSFDARAAAGMGIDIGDTITVNVLGRPLTAKIANLRAIDWRTLRVNFVMIFSPGVIETAPQTYIAAIKINPDLESDVQRAVTEHFTNINTISVREILNSIAKLMSKIAAAVQTIAGVTVLAGGLVLASSIASGQHRRKHEAVLFKVLGARPRDVLTSLIWEYGSLTIFISGFSTILGSVAGWAIITQLMGASWTPNFEIILMTAILSGILIIFGSVIGTWGILKQKPATFLRND